MTNPTILVIDDDANVLNAVERDMRKKFGREYHLIKAASGASALETILELQKRNEAVALFLTDQRMPLMTGLQFLEQAREIYPEAKRVLLTAYADTDVAISSINKLVLDYYLMKPWDPPEDNLYPVVEDLLAEAANHNLANRQVWDMVVESRKAGTLSTKCLDGLFEFLVTRTAKDYPDYACQIVMRILPTYEDPNRRKSISCGHTESSG